MATDTAGSPLDWDLREISIELTHKCNLTCAMCAVWEGRRDGLPGELVRELLAAARRLGATAFLPSGAESFMRKDTLALLRHADALGFERQEIVTNGILLPHLADALAAIPSVRLHVSIDGPEPVHDALRGPAAYARAVAGVRAAVARGIPVGLSAVLMRPTLDTAEHVVDLACDLGAGSVSLQPFQPEIAGPGRDHAAWTFPAEDRAYVAGRLRAIRAYARARGMAVFTGSVFDRIVPYLFDGIRPIPPGGCHMPSRFILVASRGQTYPCFFMRGRSMGNVARGDRLEAIWHGPAHLALQRLALGSRCPGCLAACSDIASFDAAASRDTVVHLS